MATESCVCEGKEGKVSCQPSTARAPPLSTVICTLKKACREERGGKEEESAKERGRETKREEGNLVIHRHNSQTVKVTKCIACHFPLTLC